MSYSALDWAIFSGHHLMMSCPCASGAGDLSPYIPPVFIYIASSESEITGHGCSAHQHHVWLLSIHTAVVCKQIFIVTGRKVTWILLKSIHKVSRAKLKDNNVMIIQWSDHPLTKICHAGKCYIWVELLCNIRWPTLLIYLICCLKQNSNLFLAKPTLVCHWINWSCKVHQSSYLTIYPNNWNFLRVLCNYFSNADFWRLLFSYILYMVELFCTELPFTPHFILCLVYFLIWCSIPSLILRLVIIILFPEALCLPVLVSTILLVKLNIIFGVITQIIKILCGLYCIVFKSILFWCGNKYKLAPGIFEISNKRSCISDTLTGWVNFP